MVSKEEILKEIKDELDEIKSLNYYNSELAKRKNILEQRIISMEGECSMRDYEMNHRSELNESKIQFQSYDDDSFSDDNYGYVSPSFVDPSQYY